MCFTLCETCVIILQQNASVALTACKNQCVVYVHEVKAGIEFQLIDKNAHAYNI